MTFVQATTGSGGWPMSVFLTPELNPFYGGTYFPVNQQYGMPSFMTVLKQIASMWKERPEVLKERASDVIESLKNGIKESLLAADKSFDNEEINAIMKKVYLIFKNRFDNELGGFGDAPKFPRPVELDVLMRLYNSSSWIENAESDQVKEQIQKMVRTTLKRMSLGGIYDHLGGGFHRYSVDEFWHVPQ